jgi:DNA-binding response OmpR family regulator
MGHILIIEDDKPLAELLAWVIQQEGHDVSVAENADDGIQLGLDDPPDLIITDWILKHSVHGGEISRRIRLIHPEVKTIVITGHPEIVSQSQAWLDWIDMVLEKPFHMRHLFVAIRRMLRQDSFVYPPPHFSLPSTTGV